MSKKKQKCIDCGDDLAKDEVGLSKKIIEPDGTQLFCYECMADYLGCTVDDLIEKVKQFKEEGCTLFQ